MKKNLTLLTGIAVIAAILIAGSCQNDTKPKGEGTAIPETDTITSEDFPVILENDSTIGISLGDTVISCKRRLFMQNVSQRGPEGKKVIDSLYTDVYHGYTVKWAKEKKTNIHKIHQVRIINALTWNLIDTCIVAGEDEDYRGAFKLEIPSTADTGVYKYEIIFEDTDHVFWCIDPYLRIKGTRPR